jgi:hypothetical protein
MEQSEHILVRSGVFSAFAQFLSRSLLIGGDELLGVDAVEEIGQLLRHEALSPSGA